jgi:hypothetical protein
MILFGSTKKRWQVVDKSNIEANSFFKKYKKIFVVVLIAAAIVAAIAVTVVLIVKSKNNKDGDQAYVVQEFDPNEVDGETSDAAAEAHPGFTDEEIQQLKEELAEAYAAMEKANADFNAEMSARAADKAALEDFENKTAELISEKNRLLAELDAKEVELVLKTPPVLDIKKIVGMYEGYGELVTLTYSYEIMIEEKTQGNIFTNKNILYSIPGTLKIGVNFDRVKNGIVANDTAKTVTVTIPAAYFVSNAIDENNVERYDVSRGIFSKVEDKDYLRVAGDAKKKAENQVTDNGMLPYAQRLAGLEFIGLLEPVTSKSGYQIVVVYGK